MSDRIADAAHYLETQFAPWTKALGIRAVGFDDRGGDFVLPRNPDLVHAGGVICGQASAAAVDTCAPLTLSVFNGRFRKCTTVDLTTHFIRPLPPGDVEIRVDILQNGKRMAFLSIGMRAAGDTRLAVTATTAFAYLED